MDSHELPNVEQGSFYNDDENPQQASAIDLAEGWKQANDRITEARKGGSIPDAYLGFLEGMLGEESAHYPEVNINLCLDIRTAVPTLFSKSDVIAYVGSGYDWRLPIALGARKIDMVDLAFHSSQGKTQLFELVQQFDSHASREGDEIIFSVGFDGIQEQVRLRTVPADIFSLEEYPAAELGGVLEHAGPTKGRTVEEPVIPVIRRKLKHGAVILNTDFSNPNFLPEQYGLQAKQIGRRQVFQVVTPAK